MIASSLRIALISLLAMLAWSTVASAQTAIIDEFRFGAVSMNPDWLEDEHPEENQFGVNAELLFVPFDFDFRADPREGFVRSLLTPRFHLGADVNFDDDGTSIAYAGLTWQHDLTEKLFFEWSLGLALNDGELNGELNDDLELTRARLGSHITFREQVAFGYRMTERLNVLVGLSHNSHSRLFDDKNRGLTNATVKLGVTF